MVMIKDHETHVMEDILRNQELLVDKEVLLEIETFRSAIARIEKYREDRKQVEVNLDQRQVAQALCTYLAAQRANQEEKIRQEKARLEAQTRVKEEAERAKEVARKEVAYRKAHEERIRQEKAIADRKALEERIRLEKARLDAAKKEAEREKAAKEVAEQTLEKERVSVAATSNVQAAESALRLENQRMKKLEELEATNQSLKSRSNQDFSSYEKRINRAIRQITNRNASERANDIVEIFKDPRCPLSISIAAFAKKMITDVCGNIHGIEHGWAWFAGFLNGISANDKASTTALYGFLQTAGFGLHQRYKTQFLKLVNVFREHFLAKLRMESELQLKKGSSGLQTITTEITTYLDNRMYLKEPEGRRMFTEAQVDEQNNNHHNQRNY
ncbi:hypothetical protein AALP_AA8G235500 [Arabis alpina]|uniref:mRNA export factor GLE1 n=1 Tax=Arabis alpina TaxID=50452 RepID=A0A087G8Z1_ARAAL|nr:hypothetical protein AALP_AA8G235500 [Arabis alpina]